MNGVDSRDSSYAAQAAIRRYWHAATPSERILAAMTLNDDVEGVARAGVRAANPDYPEVQIVRELFRRRYGDRLTDTVYGALAV